jgi:hypothetical protein
MILGVITGAVVLALLHLLPKVWQRKDSAAQA